MFRTIFWGVFWALFVFGSQVQAAGAVDQDLVGEVRVSGELLSIAVTADGKWVCALTAGGMVQLYGLAEKRTETIAVDPAMDLMVAGPGNTLTLGSRKTGSIQVIALVFAKDINIDGAPFLGEVTAPVTVVAFSDFECPHCAKMGPVFEELLDKYPASIKIVFKNFPLKIHPLAAPAAKAALAAQQQGKFWQYHDLLFANRTKLTPESFVDFAAKLGLDVARFKKDMAGWGVRMQLEQDMLDGRKAGVDGTPTVFVNGRLVKNNSFAALAKVIGEELARRERTER